MKYLPQKILSIPRTPAPEKPPDTEELFRSGGVASEKRVYFVENPVTDAEKKNRAFFAGTGTTARYEFLFPASGSADAAEVAQPAVDQEIAIVRDDDAEAGESDSGTEEGTGGEAPTLDPPIEEEENGEEDATITRFVFEKDEEHDHDGAVPNTELPLSQGAGEGDGDADAQDGVEEHVEGSSAEPPPVDIGIVEEDAEADQSEKPLDNSGGEVDAQTNEQPAPTTGEGDEDMSPEPAAQQDSQDGPLPVLTDEGEQPQPADVEELTDPVETEPVPPEPAGTEHEEEIAMADDPPDPPAAAATATGEAGSGGNENDDVERQEIPNDEDETKEGTAEHSNAEPPAQKEKEEEALTADANPESPDAAVEQPGDPPEIDAEPEGGVVEQKDAESGADEPVEILPDGGGDDLLPAEGPAETLAVNANDDEEEEQHPPESAGQEGNTEEEEEKTEEQEKTDEKTPNPPTEGGHEALLDSETENGEQGPAKVGGTETGQTPAASQNTSNSVTRFHPSYPAQILVCSCSMCRRATGGLYVPFGAFPRNKVKFISQNTLRKYKSSEAAIRGFCGKCGSQVYMDYPHETHTIWLTLALLDAENDLGSCFQRVFTDVHPVGIAGEGSSGKGDAVSDGVADFSGKANGGDKQQKTHVVEGQHAMNDQEDDDLSVGDTAAKPITEEREEAAYEVNVSSAEAGAAADACACISPGQLDHNSYGAIMFRSGLV